MNNPDEYLVNHYSALGRDWRNANLYSLVAEQVVGKSVLDIGSGAGSFAKVLKNRGKEVLGFEPSLGMRALAAKVNPDIQMVSELRGKFDAITMLDVLEHIEDDGGQVRKVNLMLNPRGRFIIVVPAHPVLYGERDKKMGHFRRYTQKSLKEVLEKNGFEIKSMRFWNAIGFLPYFVSEKILRKPLEAKSRDSGSRLFSLWFKYVENNFDFGFGLSIICVAEKHV